jgi:serine/threonine protein kinase
MAPEVYEGRGGKPADVYAFAMMLFEAFEGTSSFRGLDYRIVQCRVESRVRPNRPYHLASDKVWNLIQRAWAQDPDARPTFDEIVNEMEQWIEQETL